MKSDSKRRAIIISFQFPPRGNTASQRSNAWSMYLAEFGYHPVIITKNYDESEKRLLTHSSHPASDIYRIRAKEIMQVHSQNLAKDDKRIRAKAYSLLRTVFHFSYIFGPYRVSGIHRIRKFLSLLQCHLVVLELRMISTERQE